MEKRCLTRSKGGAAIDVDWIISLGIFLVYLGVFFITIRQVQEPQSPSEALLDNVIDGIAGSAEWHVQQLPLVITSNITSTEPVIVKFAYDWRNFSFSDNATFDLKGGRLILAKSLREGKNVLQLVSSGENYTAPQSSHDMAASESLVSVNSQRFTASFQNFILSSANHFEEERLNEFNLTMSGVELKPETATASSNISAFSAQYDITFPQLNHTSIVVAGYSRIISYATPLSAELHNLTISATVRNYTFFHIDNEAAGTINYSIGGCTARKGSFLDFNDGTSGLTFLVPEGSNISFCVAETTVRVGIEMAVQNDTRYELIFHTGDQNSTLKYIGAYTTAFGVAENLTGLSMRLLQGINQTDYAALKRNWTYPNSREFSFTILNESGYEVVKYQPKTPGITNVFAKETNVFILDSYGSKERHKLRARGW